MKKTNAISTIKEQLLVSEKDAGVIFNKGKEGGEFSIEIESWVNDRLLPNCVFIDEIGYSKMCVNALKILDRTASTDYGSSRQRDLGQLWADMTRGYLGEYAFQLFLEKHWSIKSQLGHEIGELEEFLQTDIHQIKKDSAKFRQPHLNISVKTSKWNGIWLDIPGDQFDHSDIHVFVKVGTGRDHLFAFFKHISVFKDKVLRKGEEVGSLTNEESHSLFNRLPNFAPIPAYICGFVPRQGNYGNLPYSGKMGKKHYTITGWNGPMKPGDLEQIKQLENVPEKVKFSSIGSFSHDKGYLFNSGNLLWSQDDWNEVINQL